MTKSVVHRGPPAFALVLVLSFLVLITVLVVAFFFSVTTELSGSRSYADQAASSQLADTVVQTAIATVREATNCDSTKTWASQPGMIRKFDNNGAATAYYKLYSSDNAILTQSTTPAIGNPPAYDPASDVPSSWSLSPALFTDLNAPVSTESGARLYPIIDPSVRDNPATAPKGFSITSAPLSSVTTSYVNPAPMPVRWLYLLKDGTLTAPTGGSGSQASWSGSSAAPNSKNPIIGRVSFWTDDDTCKVNINTAAGDVWTDGAVVPGQPGNPGSFWDIPRVNSAFEKTYLAKNQPAKNEFQRYPGHPATTYLSAVFPSLTTTQIYAIASRVALGGSKSGTTVADPDPNKQITTPPDNDRLYASVDELLLQTDRSKNPPLTADQVKKARFFLTARSRAPEVNPFNQPRVGVWPVSEFADAAHRTAFDSLIAHCGTLNSNTYFFQRKNPASPTEDLPINSATTGVGRNRSIINYLRHWTSQPVPGFGGGTFLAKYPFDRDQIVTEIFDYTRALNAQDQSVNGLNSYAVTHPTSQGGVTGQGQIVPITDDSHTDSNTETLRGFGRFPTLREASIVIVGVGQTSGANKSIPPDGTQNPEKTNPTTGVVTGAPIADGFTRVQAFFSLNFFDPSQGFAITVPDFKLRITGLDGFKWNGSSMGFPSSVSISMTKNNNSGAYGGYRGATCLFGNAAIVLSGYLDLPTASTFLLTGNNVTGNKVIVELRDTTDTTVLQTLDVIFPNSTLPVPELAPLLQDKTQLGITMNTDFRSLTKYTGSYGSMPTSVGRFTAGTNANTSGSEDSKTWLCGKDVIRSVQANTDCRLIAARKNVPSSYFSVVPDYHNSGVRQVHSIAEAVNGGGIYPFVGSSLGKFVADADYGSGAGAPVRFAADYSYNGVTGDGLQPKAAGPMIGNRTDAGPIAYGMRGGNCVPLNGAYAGTNATDGTANGYPPGDWDTGFSFVTDGAFINKADEGTTISLSTGKIPYFQNLAAFASAGSTFFSPNRMMPSAGMFGSLPTGVRANRPWQTLLFHPEPLGSTQRHLGATGPKDHLLLEFFTMPVVEPYAISDPFSSAGKVNMNYVIAPFSYIERSTAVRAVLRSEQLLVLQNGDAATYKLQSATFPNRRSFLDLDETLKGFDARFDAHDLFRSASEICDMWLVPVGQAYLNMGDYWQTRLLTGDNVRERPYANIYPRLTTKSNSYTVHYRVQTLKKAKTSSADLWDEKKDVVTAELRGSTSFERYLDTDDTSIPDYATDPNATPLERYYKYRIVESTLFAP